jgi:hypothetical protein
MSEELMDGMAEVLDMEGHLTLAVAVLIYVRTDSRLVIEL